MIACLAMFALGQAESAETYLIQGSKAKAEIVLSVKPARAAEFGAQELQTYLEKISGARIKIVTEPTAGALVKIYVGESEHARDIGITAKGLKRDAFKMVSGENWLALVGNDLEFEPREPWARHHNQWAQEKQSEWDKITRKPWMNPIGRRLYRNYNKQLDLWNFDHRGSLNAVYAFLRELGVRWYMPGELGEILPQKTNVI
ncbi:MAG TPA: hypothetical protein QF373_08590, partial [Verrucomicrobiota bacterium]|nr:hypothetical protein [Verrucomicrobiota bacterium]